MKRLIPLLVIVLAQAASYAQGSSGLIALSVDFGAAPPPYAPGTVGSASASLSAAFPTPPGSRNLSIGVAPFMVRASSARVVEEAEDGSLTPVFELVGSVDPGNPVPLLQYAQVFRASSSQVESILAGAWYLQMDFGGTTYQATITRPVPEPSILALAAVAAVTGAIRWKGFTPKPAA